MVEIYFKLNVAMLAAINKGLMTVPYGEAAPVVETLKLQYHSACAAREAELAAAAATAKNKP